MSEPLDLFLITPAQCRGLMQHFAYDSVLLNALMDLEQAILNGDEEGRMEAIGILSDELVLKRGGSSWG